MKKIKNNKMNTMLSSSGPFTLIKFIPVSFATALASKVLPHPGGPHNKTPCGWLLRPITSKSSGLLIGY